MSGFRLETLSFESSAARARALDELKKSRERDGTIAGFAQRAIAEAQLSTALELVLIRETLELMIGDSSRPSSKAED